MAVLVVSVRCVLSLHSNWPLYVPLAELSRTKLTVSDSKDQRMLRLVRADALPRVFSGKNASRNAIEKIGLL